jgi:4-hydroxythreonine-4-phosphate dehydrogenase
VSELPRLAVTLGDPRGIGPEIVAKMLRDGRGPRVATLIVVGPTGAGIDVDERVGGWDSTAGDAAAGRAAGAAIERAVRLALDGTVDGIVTAPLEKSALVKGGYDFPGHTEMLAQLTGSRVAMMLTSADSARGGPADPDRPAALRVVLATTHIPLRDVAGALTRDRIVQIAQTTRQGLRDWFRIAEPRIALCALNPHGGDSGRFGSEDDDLLRPAAREARVAGPFPADTVFVRAMRGEFDAVIAPYHDVGMTAIKVAAFGKAVNVTLGLPFPRCSPDHGTALDIATKGIADPSSMIEATLLCASLARVRNPQARPVAG